MAASFLHIRQPEGAPLSRPEEAATSYTMTRWAEPEDDGCGESDGGEESSRASIEARSDAAPILEAAEHILNFYRIGGR
jgi:hypothetical protein